VVALEDLVPKKINSGITPVGDIVERATIFGVALEALARRIARRGDGRMIATPLLTSS